MLIGVEIYWDIICVGQIKATEMQPYWQKTHFGWIAAGGVVTRSHRTGLTVCNLRMNDELNNTIKRFWEIEHCVPKSEMSLEECRCVEYFESTVKRSSEGQFIVKLPIKSKEMSLLGSQI